MYHYTVPHLVRILTNIKSFLKKAELHAETKKFDPNLLMQSRLAPDMFPFVKQVQVATDMAKGCAARLTGKEPPKYEDNETTFAELYARLDRTIGYLNSFKADEFRGSEDRRVTLPWAPGKYMMGADYVMEMVIPNVYFHATTAYAILRNNGVDVGKMDFLGNVTMRE